MASPGYRAVMTKESLYNKLLVARNNLSSLTKSNCSISDVLQYMLQRTLLSVDLDKELMAYILKTVKIVSQDKDVQGIALFGSIAKNNYNNSSDVDFFIVVDDDYDYTNKLWEVRKKLLPAEESFIKEGKYYRFSPLVVSKAGLSRTIPLYFDIADYGIILYEKNSILTDFFSRIRTLPHKRRIMPAGVELKWKRM